MKNLESANGSKRIIKQEKEQFLKTKEKAVNKNTKVINTTQYSHSYDNRMKQSTFEQYGELKPDIKMFGSYQA